MKDTSRTAGACSPIPATATMKPSVAASEYPGAVDATPMTRLETNPSASFFRPLSPTCGLGTGVMVCPASMARDHKHEPGGTAGARDGTHLDRRSTGPMMQP